MAGGGQKYIAAATTINASPIRTPGRLKWSDQFRLLPKASFRTTLAAASTLDKEVRGELKYGGNKTAAAAVGKAIAQKALEAGVKEVVFDRREYKYHGRVAALADAARAAGLVF